LLRGAWLSGGCQQDRGMIFIGTHSDFADSMSSAVVYLGIYTYALRSQGRRTRYEPGILFDKGHSNFNDAIQRDQS